MLWLWRRSPVIVRAVVTGLVVAVAGTTPWAVLAAANLKLFPDVPWAVLPMAVYLWLFWRYLNGAGWPGSTAEERRRNLRAKRLSGEVWGAALLAGVLGIATVVLLLRVVNRFVRLPEQQPPDVSHMSLAALLSLLLVSAAVAGIVEEAAFRGYMQGPIERRHGALIAILVTGGVFGLAHFGHAAVTLILMPYYMAVAAVYGALVYLTKSILPGIVLHAGGNVLGGVGLLTRGQSEWQSSSSPAPLLWETGADPSFWLTCMAVLLVGAATVWAYVTLARIVRKGP
jgi:membrane protease YdiL (CAAX protease family)